VNVWIKLIKGLIMYKKIVFCLVALCTLFALSSCSNSADYDLGSVFVTINESYKENFQTNNIIIEDFKWENISEINYGEWSVGQNIGYMTVSLEVYGIKEVENAINHFVTLDFVQSAEKNFNYSQI